MHQLPIEQCEGPIAELVTAALQGELKTVLAGGTAAPRAGREEPGARGDVFLKRLKVTGFRGLGPPAEIHFEDRPGLTLVTGPNGAGKSSFSEGLELLLTGESSRWKGRTQAWKEGWRNLHHPDETSLEAEFSSQGEALTVTRHWLSRAPLASGTTSGLEGLGWTEGLRRHRPILSYGELGSMLTEGPSKLYDALATVLGLEDVSQALKALRDERLAGEAQLKALRLQAGKLEDDLKRSRHPRAAQAIQALAWPFDLEKLNELARREQVSIDLVCLAQLQLPEEREVSRVTRRLEQAWANRQKSPEPAAGHSESCRLLRLALDLQQGDDCCVCAQPLPEHWSQATEAALQALERSGRDFHAAEGDWLEAVQQAQDLLDEPPAWLSDAAEELSFDATQLLRDWGAWYYGGDHTWLERIRRGDCDRLVAGLRDLRQKAREAVGVRDSDWSYLSHLVERFVDRARLARSAHQTLERLAAAEHWLKSAADRMRMERFAPVAAQAERNWRLLSPGGRVELRKLVLCGSATTRKVGLDVCLEGPSASAVGVLSQGELNALALSLFLPRATLPGSPFRFVVLDDPAQSMDGERLEGLARALAATASDRQVVVFSHDPRLAQAVRRLGGTLVELERGPGSRVQVTTQYPLAA